MLLLIVVFAAVVCGAWQTGMMAHYASSRVDLTIPRPEAFDSLAKKVRAYDRIVMVTHGHPRDGSERHYSAQFSFAPCAVLALDAPSADVLVNEILPAILLGRAVGIRRVRGVFEALSKGAPAVVDAVDPKEREAIVAVIIESEKSHGYVRSRVDVGHLVLLTRTGRVP